VKTGPVLAMIALMFVGLWLVLQPTLNREASDFQVQVGAVELRAQKLDDGSYLFVSPEDLAARGPMTASQLASTVDERVEAWNARPSIERTLLGFFNISSWFNFTWVAIGLVGQSAFFGRMFVQWVVSEKKRRSEVPELFWWFSLMGGVCLFTYFVWRVDVVGVLGQSTGVVIYSRNLRLIHKHRKREARYAAAVPEPGSQPGVPGDELT